MDAADTSADQNLTQVLVWLCNSFSLRWTGRVIGEFANKPSQSSRGLVNSQTSQLAKMFY